MCTQCSRHAGGEEGRGLVLTYPLPPSGPWLSCFTAAFRESEATVPLRLGVVKHTCMFPWLPHQCHSHYMAVWLWLYVHEQYVTEVHSSIISELVGRWGGKMGGGKRSTCTWPVGLPPNTRLVGMHELYITMHMYTLTATHTVHTIHVHVHVYMYMCVYYMYKCMLLFVWALLSHIKVVQEESCCYRQVAMDTAV